MRINTTAALILLLTALLAGCGGGSSTTSGATVLPFSSNIVDTNQTACYDSLAGSAIPCTGTGYDADYSGNQPSYTVSGDGLTVLDNVTGLRWTKSTDINNSGAVDYSDKLSQSAAVTYCASLTTDGYVWRLPNIKEAYSLILFSGRDASSFTGTDTSKLTPFISNNFDWAFGDTTAGDRIIDAQYATTTLYVSTTMINNQTMFGVNYVDGRIKGYPTATKKFYVRCVTGNTSYGVNQFKDNGDQTISDSATGLMWQKNDSGPVNWDNAVSSCENATTATYTDWRLPNAKELQSIVDYTRSPDKNGGPAIDPIFNSTPIINENGVADWGYYWASTTHVENNGNGSNAAYFSFGRALGYFDAGTGTQQILDVHGAGAQRSDNKLSAASVPGVLTADVGYGLFYYHGPQGDIQRSNNMVRCVR